MGKYDKLGDHLDKHDSDRVKLTFQEIEEILGFPLPRSARVHRPWWANDKYHSQAVCGWINYGWRVSFVNMDAQQVIFERARRTARDHEIQNRILPTTAMEFENVVRTVMSRHYRTDLFPGKIFGVPKLFDMVSADKTIAGDAKYLTMVRGEYLPPAKFSVIAEHIWLLEKTGAKERFLVFGNDRRVPEEWLKRYGKLIEGTKFFFYDIKRATLFELN